MRQTISDKEYFYNRHAIFFLQCKHNILYRIKSPSLAKAFRYSMFGISQKGMQYIGNPWLAKME